MSLVQNRTEIVGQKKLGTDIKAASDIVKLTGAPLGSPINGLPTGKQFDVTLTGSIELRKFNGVTSAHYLLEKGFSIRVNASFDPKIHKAGATFPAEVREMQVTNADGSTRMQKFLSFVETV